jgi:hypothetical protein
MNRFARASAVADAVLFEGYALYPYRASSTKNQLRWQFGVVAPRAYSERSGSDPWWIETHCLFAPAGDGARLEGKLRFLRLRRRRILDLAGTEVPSLEVGGELLLPWDESEVVELALDFERSETPFSFSADATSEPVRDPSGRELARLVRRREPLSGRILIASEPVSAERALTHVTVRVENLSPEGDLALGRDAALTRAALGAHFMIAAIEGELLSLIDPPPFAEAAAKEASRRCRTGGSWPVLAGEPGAGDLVLSAPIILPDHPEVAPESPGDLFDATEIDEILSLRTLMLTDEEKRQARATDQRVRQVIDRVDCLPEESWSKLHGAIRGLRRLDPPPVVAVGGITLVAGSQVRLKPGARRTDAQDLFLAGRIATVREIKRDVDGRDCLAVTIDDDPAAELHLWHGRFHYFYLDEIEPIA